MAEPSQSEDLDIGPLEPGEIRSLAGDAILQLRRYGEQLAATDGSVDGETVAFLLDSLANEIGVGL